jgi:hypothetical protein
MSERRPDRLQVKYVNYWRRQAMRDGLLREAGDRFGRYRVTEV